MTEKIIAIFSDTHSLLDSFNAMRADAIKAGATVFWNLGDSVGYYLEPVPVVEAVRQLMTDYPDSITLMGNHDAGLCNRYIALEDNGKVAPFDVRMNQTVQFSDTANHLMAAFNMNRFQEAALNILLAQQGAFRENEALYRWLDDRPLRANPLEGFFLAHGKYTAKTDSDSVWGYATKSRFSARSELNAMHEQVAPFRFLAVGHSHIAGVWQLGNRKMFNPLLKQDMWETKLQFTNLRESPIIVNPGSISFPRETDQPNTASYVLMRVDTADLDNIEICFRRVQFNAEAAMNRIQDGYFRRAVLIRELKQVQQATANKPMPPSCL